jgi:uncharacterized membrane protein
VIKRQLAILAVALTALLGLPGLVATASAAQATTQTTSPDCYGKVTSSGKCSTSTSPVSSQPVSSSSHSSAKKSSPSTSTVTPSNQGVLAFTGADVMVTIAVAGLLLAIGLVIVGLTRRRTS